MFEYNLYTFFFYYCWQNVMYIKSFFITIIIKWCFCWYCLMMRVLLSFLFHITLVRSHRHCNGHWPSNIVLRTSTSVFPKHFETLSIEIPFKQCIAWNRMHKGHVNLVICLNWMHYIFLNIFFLVSFFKWFPSNFKFIGKTVPFPSTDITIIN